MIWYALAFLLVCVIAAVLGHAHRQPSQWDQYMASHQAADKAEARRRGEWMDKRQVLEDDGQ
ncbi:MAG: hypothetical protein OES13_00280 [Acidimicrobiia bacterium]|nr:hypothetical protein [Acidimicrobiia bacterium]